MIQDGSPYDPGEVEPDDDDPETAIVAYDQIVHETEEAVLFLIDGIKEWIPRSQIFYIDDTDKEMVLAEWLAIKKGLV